MNQKDNGFKEAALNGINAPQDSFHEFLTDLSVFSRVYVDEIRTQLIQDAKEIFKDKTTVRLLHEYNTRLRQEQEEYERDVKYSVTTDSPILPSNHCLTHSKSYQDVLEDLLIRKK